MQVNINNIVIDIVRWVDVWMNGYIRCGKNELDTERQREGANNKNTSESFVIQEHTQV